MSAASKKAANTEAGRLSPQFIDKLVKILGLLGSAHDGEVAAAGRRAQLLITAAGWTWRELLAPPPPPVEKKADPPPETDPREVAARAQLDLVEVCLAAGDLFEDYETKFLANIRIQLRCGRPVTAKQLEWLLRLHARATEGKP